MGYDNIKRDAYKIERDLHETRKYENERKRNLWGTEKILSLSM